MIAMKIQYGMLFAALAVCGAAVAVDWPPSGDVPWAWEYTGEVMPGEGTPRWSGDPNAGTEAKVTPDGLRIIDTTTEKGSLCRFNRSWRVDPEAGGVVEARIKLVNNTSNAGAGLMLADGEFEAHLTLYPDRIDINSGEVTVPFDPTGDFHVYRLAARQNDLFLWVDGELVVEGLGKHTHEAHAHRSYVSFGSGSSLAVSEAIYRYVRYAPLGELPLPERAPGATDTIVYKKPGVYACFPSLYRSEDGTLVTSFGTRVRRSHIDNTGGSACYQSKDGGHTWEPVEGPRPINKSLRCEDGSLVVADAWGWRHVPAERRKEFEEQDITVRTVRDGVVAYLQGARVRRSTDNGENWSQGEVQLPAHRSLMTYHRVDYDSFEEGLRMVSIYGELKEDVCTRSFALRSADDGKCWWFLPIAADPERKVRLNETALAQHASGDIIAMIRSEPPAGGPLYTTFSTDRGISWAPVQKTNIWGYPAHLLRLHDGRMLCSYGYRRAPMGIRAVISDDGRSWEVENELVIRCDGMGNGGDLGYPISIETEPGRIATIYYMTNEDGVTHVAVTHWELPPK